MSHYNMLERSVARFLAKFPFAKNVVKSIYAKWVYFGVKKSYKNKSVGEIKLLSLKGINSFFGYYDKSPENNKGLVLACITSSDTSINPTLDCDVKLVVFDSEGKTLSTLKVDAYNWQQGCRAHWIDSDLFIFNDYDVNLKRYISRVYSVSENCEVKRFTYPVQDSHNKTYFLSINYQRIMTLRPDYGYRNLPNLGVGELASLDDDGIWKVDYETGDSILFISIADALKIKPKKDFENATHKFNHVMISPDGSRFIFMHRYLVNNQRFDRLIVADVISREMHLLSDYNMVSHCYWADNNTILGYMRGPNDKDAYWLLDVNTAEFSELPCHDLVKFGDGHPHVHGDWFITDTYPDKARMQHLLWCNWKTGEVKEVGEFFHGFEFKGESRCDLHPRLSPDGKAVYFDSVFSGKRQLYKMELPS